jgi:cytochrome c55X
MLSAVILNGRPGTPMAPWQPFMNEAEAAWLVEQLQTGVINAQP